MEYPSLEDHKIFNLVTIFLFPGNLYFKLQFSWYLHSKIYLYLSISRKVSQTLQRIDTLSPSFALPRVQTPPEPILFQQQQQQSIDVNSNNDNLFVGPLNQNSNVGELQFGSRSSELSVLPVSSNSQFQSDANQLGDDANISRFSTQFQVFRHFQFWLYFIKHHIDFTYLLV